jgi:integrase
VPIPPELVRLLREHIARFGIGPDGRLFRSQNGNPIQPSTWWRVWQKVRALGLTPAQAATVPLSRPYDLRHSGVTWRLSSGVHPPEVAAWAGHSVEVLMRVYARCMTGLEDVWITRMDQTLHLEDPGRPGD